MQFNRFLSGVVFIGLLVGAANAQSLKDDLVKGLPYFYTYTPEDYPGEQQNRWVMQWQDGSILVANSGGLLQHSDSDWRIFGDGQIKYISALKHSSTNKDIIWSGSFSNIGYFAQNDSSYFSYHSLTEKIADPYRNFSAVSAIEEFHGNVYFLNDLHLFSYSTSEDTVRFPEQIDRHLNAEGHRVSHITQWHEKLYVFTNNGTIITLDGSGKSTIMEIAGVQLNAIVTSDNIGTQMLLGDANAGLFLFDGTSIKPFETTVNDYLEEYAVQEVLYLTNGDIAVATDYGGTLVLNAEGRLKYLLSPETGLQENVHNHLYEDNAGDLWIAGNESITKVFTGVPVRHLNGNIFGFNDALQITHYNDHLYVGSLDGLFRLDHPLEQLYQIPATDLFTEISPEPAPFWDFLEVDGKQWVGGNSGLYEIDGDEIVQLFSLETFLIKRFSEDKILIVTSNGVNLLQKRNNEWVDEGPLEVANFYVYSLVVVNEHTFWAGGVQGQLVKVAYDEATETFTQKNYTAADGVLPGDVYEPTLQHGELIVNSNSGFMHYNESADRFEPYTGLNKTLGEWGEYLRMDESGNYWNNYITPDYRGIVKLEPRDDDSWERVYTAFEISRDHFGDFIEIDGRHMWVGSTQSIMYRDLYQPFDQPKPEVYIWNVRSAFDQEMLSLSAPMQEISYQQRNMGIDLASTSYRFPEKNQFRYKIGDSEWSEWRAESIINVATFFPGHYEFTVQTRDFIRQMSEPVTYSISIAAPWYLSNWAYMLYFLMFGMGLFAMVRGISNYRVRREMQDLKLQEAEKMVELDAMKDRLFANISHEFRTPLTISHGLVKKALQQFSDEGEKEIKKRDLLVINRNMIRLKDMVDQIIDLTQSDQNYLKLKQNHYPAGKLTSLSVESFRSLAEFHGHTFEFIDESEHAVLFADRSKVEIMINNLISNAIKFTPNGGSIVIKAEVKDDQFMLTVADDGPGIPAGEEDAIFERFHRIERSDEEYVEGMGVGLELSRTLARLHGGEVIAKKGQSKGASFVLTLPLAETDDTTPIIELEDFESEYELPEERTFESNKLARLEKSTRQVLLVEDNADMRSYVEGILSDVGEVTTANDGQEALALIPTLRPDLIITDLMMPNMDGKTLVKRLAAHDLWKEIPIIVLTAKALEQDKTDLLRIGVVDYITKPFEPEQLMLKVRNLLKYADRRHELQEPDEEELLEPELLSNQVISYIREHLSDQDLTVTQLVSAFPQSRRSFYRNIQRNTGMTPSELIREVRFKAARSMAESETNYTLDELSDAVGYKSTTSFRKAFEKSYGKHPLE